MSSISVHIPIAPFLPNPLTSKERRALIIKDDLIGDLAHISGVIKALQSDYETFVVMRKEFVPVGKLFLEEKNIIPLNYKEYRNNIRYRYNFLKELRGYGFRLAMGSTTHSTVNSDILKHCGSVERWGYLRKDTFKERYSLRGCNKVKALNYFEDDVYAPVLKHEAYFLSQVLNKSFSMDDIKPELIKMKPLDKVSGDYIVYLSDARASKRVYPKEKLLPMLSLFTEKYGIKVLVTAIDKMDGVPENLINITGKTSVSDMISLVQNSKGVVGSESGLTHISWISDIPTVMFYGGGHYGRFLPLHSCTLLTKRMDCFCCDWKCIYRDKIVPCVMVEEKEVEKALERLFTQ